MKTLLLVIILLTNGQVELSHRQFNTTQECVQHIDAAIEWANKQPNSSGAIAVCTTKLQPVGTVV